MNCKYCSTGCIKAGLQRSGIQKFYCKSCKKYQQAVYSSEAYHVQTNNRIVMLVREGICLRGIARVLRISLKTVIHRIRQIRKSIRKPFYTATDGIYEMDELWSYIRCKSNETWIMYMIDRSTRSVIDYRTGARTKANLRTLTDQLLQLNPKAICTDGLTIYRSLIPNKVHRTGLPGTRHIERHNLNLRTHLKRLSRKTICFSKSAEMLDACLRIYFWGTSYLPIP